MWKKIRLALFAGLFALSIPVMASGAVTTTSSCCPGACCAQHLPCCP